MMTLERSLADNARIDEKTSTTSIPSFLENAPDSTVSKAIEGQVNLTEQALPPPHDQSPRDSEKIHDLTAVPPNGGWHAWLQVLGSHLLFVNHWGTVNAFGAFQAYYEINPLWKESPSNISWIGSTQAFLLLLIGFISGPAYDAGYFSALIIAGSFLVTFGFFMVSLCQTYWQTMLAQGICMGLGNGLLFIPSVAILPQYFTTKKALANGIAASGSSIGGIIYPIAFNQLVQKVGFGWATRVLGFICLVTCAFSISVMRQRVLPKQKRKMIQLEAFKELPYSLFTIGMFMAFVGFYVPLYYLEGFAIQKGICAPEFAFYLLPILNAASILGRILPNFIADHIGPLNVLVPCAVATGILALAWAGIKDVGGTIAFAVLYGFFSGGFISMPPVAITALTQDLRTIGTRMGQCFFIGAFGLLIGTPMSGAILSKTGSWLALQLFSGGTIFVTGCLMVWARVKVVGWTLRKKA